MQRDVNKNIFSHPNNKELADFLEKKLNENKRAEITRHLIECDNCSDVIALLMKYRESVEKKTSMKSNSKKEHKILNNIYYKGLGIALVASLVLLMIMPTTKENKPFIDFYTLYNQESDFKGVVNTEVKDIKKVNQEINDFLKEITKSIDMSYLKEFNQAEKKLKRKEFDDARELYQKAMNIVDEAELDKKEKDKQSIVITYSILLLSIAEGDDESANEYKEVLRDNVRRFWKRWL